MENYFFLENYVTSEGAVSYNVLYHQPLPITRYQVVFDANNYFEYLITLVSTAFKLYEGIGHYIASTVGTLTTDIYVRDVGAFCS